MSRDLQAEERFLVLAPTGRDAALTCGLLERAGLDAVSCDTIQQLCERFEEGAAALLIAEEALARGGADALSHALARQSSWSDIPIVIFTGKTAQAPTRADNPQQLSDIGNVILLERPLQPVSMLSAARSSLRARRRQYQARAELFAQQRAVRERDQFLAMLGHELRNPLSAISMAIGMDTDSDSDSETPNRSKSRDIMLRQLGHLTRLVDDLLDVARVTSGKIVLRLEDVELGALTRRCVQLLAPSAKEGTLLDFIEPEAPIWVRADTVRMEQIVNNLLNNALKYTGAGGAIEARVAVEGDNAVLRVQDSGIGLSPDMVDRVFDLFTQVESSLDRAQGGMGIGLTLVRNLAELHGGSVKAISAGLGRGSEFSLRLPRIAHVASSGKPAPARSHNGHAKAQACDVLIVEDNEDSRELLAAILNARGYHVSIAEDGLQGVEHALAHKPQVLLVDIGLPGLDGYGLAREVRSKLGAAPYLVALTGYGQPEDRSRAMDAGFDVHLTKPVDIKALENLLAHRNESVPRAV